MARKKAGSIRQEPETGKWTLSDIRHDGPDNLIIPATFTYNGDKVNFEIPNSGTAIETSWETEIGKEIELSAITREYSPVIIENKKYIVSWDDDFEVIPGVIITYELEVKKDDDIISSLTIESAETVSLKAFYVTYEDGKEVTREDVTSDALWKVTDGGEYLEIEEAGIIKGKNHNLTDQQAKFTVSYLGKEQLIVVEVKAGEYIFSGETPINVTAEQGQYSMKLLNPYQFHWELEINPEIDWISASQTAGTNDEIILSYDENIEAAQRGAVLKLRETDIKPETVQNIEFNQTSYEPQFNISPNSVVFEPIGGAENVNLIFKGYGRNCFWKIDVGSPYFSITPETGTGSTELLISTISENTANTRITESVKFGAYRTDTTGNAFSSVTEVIEQKAYSDYFELSESSITVSYTGEEKTISITNNTGLDWEFYPPTVSWINCYKGDNTLTLNISENEGYEDRESEINFYVFGVEVAEDIIVGTLQIKQESTPPLPFKTFELYIDNSGTKYSGNNNDAFDIVEENPIVFKLTNKNVPNILYFEEKMWGTINQDSTGEGFDELVASEKKDITFYTEEEFEIGKTLESNFTPETYTDATTGYKFKISLNEITLINLINSNQKQTYRYGDAIGLNDAGYGDWLVDDETGKVEVLVRLNFFITELP